MTEETSIIGAVLRGDTESFQLLVEGYQRPVLGMIRNITNDHHLCEDIAQDVFFTAYRKLRSFDSARSSLSTWLFTIARNKSLNALRKRRPIVMAELPEQIQSANPGDDLVGQEVFAELDKALQRLPDKQRIAFVLAEFEDLPYEQIAQIEGVRIGTVKSRINRAKRKLATALREFKGDI